MRTLSRALTPGSLSSKQRKDSCAGKVSFVDGPDKHDTAEPENHTGSLDKSRTTSHTHQIRMNAELGGGMGDLNRVRAMTGMTEDDKVKELQSEVDQLKAKLAELAQAESMKHGVGLDADDLNAFKASRSSIYPSSNEKRLQVPDELVPWYVPFPGYEPSDYTTKEVKENSKNYKDEKGNPAGKGWADPQSPTDVDPSLYQQRKDKAYRKYDIDDSGVEHRPKNPIGRTGIKGRGSLANWGPNFAADLIVTRVHPTQPGVLQVLTKTKGPVQALLGATLRETSRSSGADKSIADESDFPVRELFTLAQILVDNDVMAKDGLAWQYMVKELRKFDSSTGTLQHWRGVHKGYADDPRATDNAWLESQFLHMHFDEKSLSERALPELPSKVRDDILTRTKPLPPKKVLDSGGKCSDEEIELKWIALDEADPTFARMAGGNHSAVVLKARDQGVGRGKVYTPITAMPTIRESRVVALTNSPALRRKLMRKTTNVTGLIDERDAQDLLLALWQAAGKPTTAHNIFPISPEELHKRGDVSEVRKAIKLIESYMSDRKHWTRHNLRLLYDLGGCVAKGSTPRVRGIGRWAHGIQALAELQQYCPEPFQIRLSMPLTLLSLSQCNNIASTQGSYDELLVIKDKLDCILRAELPTQLNLSMKAFNHGSMRTSRNELQVIQEVLKGLKTDRKQANLKPAHHLELEASPVAALKWPPEMRELARVPADAKLFCCSTPLLSVQQLKKGIEEYLKSPEYSRKYSEEGSANSSSEERYEGAHPIASSHHERKLCPEDFEHVYDDPFVLFLIVGAFIFFDDAYRILTIASLCFFELGSELSPEPPSASKQRPPEYPSEIVGKLYLEQPSKLPLAANAPLRDAERLQPVTVDSVKAFGFTSFAWIKPVEFLGDHVFPEFGGFAYLNAYEPRESRFFPVRPPPTHAQQASARDEEPALLVPKPYDAPLHIPALDNHNSADSDLERALDLLGAHPHISVEDAELRVEEMRQMLEAEAMDDEEREDEEENLDLALTTIRNARATASSKFVHGEVSKDGVGSSSEFRTGGGEVSAIGIEKQLGYESEEKFHEHQAKIIDGELLDWKVQDGPLDEDEDEDESQPQQEGDGDRWPPLRCPPERAAESNDVDDVLRRHREHIMSTVRKLEKRFMEAKEEKEKYETEEANGRPTRGRQEADGSMARRVSLVEPRTRENDRAREAKEYHACRAIVTEVLEAVKSKPLKEIRDHVDNLYYVLCEEAEAKKGEAFTRDEGREPDRLQDFWKKPQAVKCDLSMLQVAALRLYTTNPTFKLIVEPLRASSKNHPLAITTYQLTKALKTLRMLNFSDEVDGAEAMHGAAAAEREGASRTGARTYLWRGMRDRTISEEFLMNGGSELACMSTSENIDVIATYARSNYPLILRFKIDSPMDRGANLKWLSVYPGEEEFLYPPLTFLKPLYTQKIRGLEGGQVVTLKAVFGS